MVFEETPQERSDFQKLVVGGRLAEVTGSQSGRRASIRRRIRRCDDQDRKVAELCAGSNAAQDFEAVDLREVEVQKNDLWAGRIGLALGSGNEVDGPFAIRLHVKSHGQTFLRERFLQEQRVGQIVFSQQKIQGLWIRLPGRFLQG